jgi:tripartite-type tricarboxylate transporter receptor subunit TctC
VPFLLVVHPSLPVKTLQELIVYAKAHPGEINYGSAGSGNTQHLAALQLERLSGIRMNHVPYRGAAPAITDLLPGRIQLFIGAANQLLPHIREGRLRLLATTAPRRLAHLGDIPAIGEAVPGYAVESWLGVFMPAKTPTDIVLRASVEIDRILSAPELKAKLALQGIDVMTSTPSEFARFVRDDNKRWGSLIKDSNIRLE